MPSSVARPKDGDSVRIIEKFIRDKYEHKKYLAKVVPPKEHNSEGSDNGDEKAVVRKAVITRQRPVASAIEHKEPPPPVQVEDAPAPSLIDFMDFSEEPALPAPIAAPVVPSHGPPAVPAFAPSFVGFIDFGDFSGPSSGQTTQSQPDPKSFSRFPSAEPIAAEAAAPTKPMRSADAILSLFESVPPPPIAVVNNLTGMTSITTSGDGISAMGGMAAGGYSMNGGRMMSPQGNMPTFGQPHQSMAMPMMQGQGQYAPQMPMQMPSMHMNMGQQQQQQHPHYQQAQYPQQYMQQHPQYQQQQQQQYNPQQQTQMHQSAPLQNQQMQPQMRGMTNNNLNSMGNQPQYSQQPNFQF